MEEPLISSAPRSVHFDGVDNSAGAFDRYHKAAAFVDLADDDVGLPEEVLDRPDYQSSLYWYFVDMRLNILWSLNLAALIVLNFFELPLWCDGSASKPCGSREDYYLGELPYLTSEQSFYYEVVIWVILLAHTFFPITYLGSRVFWKSRTDQLKVVLMIVLGADIIVYALYAFSSGSIINLSFRLAPYLRVMIIVIDVRTLRECVKTVVAIGKVLDIVVLSILFLLFSSVLAFVLFEDTEQGKEYFSSYGSTLYQMFVLFTTSNNPDVWLPAYKAFRSSCLFFILYILFGVYFITNLILAVVYDSFKEQLAALVKGRRCKRNNSLQAAFNLLDVEKRGFLDSVQVVSLFKSLNKYRTLPRIEEENFEAIFYALDDSGDFKITLEEFEDLCEKIALKFPKAPEPSWFERFPTFYNSVYSTKLKEFVKSQKFEYVIFAMLLLNLVAVVIEITLDLQDNSQQAVWQDIEFTFGWIYVVEMLLKIYAYGFFNYWREGLNKFDFCITIIIVVGETLTFALPNTASIISNEEWIRYLLIARLLRLIRLLMHIQRYRVIISTFLKLIPWLTPYLGMIFCLMCIYCSLGVQLFGGLVSNYNETFETTGLYENDYSVHNFNDFASGMVTLFNLLVMGSWQVWLESYVTLTGTWWTSVFFLSFYLLAILYLLNLVIAFVLEAFFVEMELSTVPIDIRKAEATELGTQKDLIEKAQQARHENVESLLNRMLGEQLEEEKS
ncbi:hypothetical protein KP509_31G023000 [Ceratopteris richardii]|uniref:EF-hand domain-containing protein n=2 Tax=Ceratopteris richardii TaxID=49495 RepID=A0A8T2QY24_CERRI|nr:hypothetical protein KP509_31G023000 [Ceratopteris richardii]KAH7288347.1 hypothetical protein KP509_31G023000 [Ceratopteris richardii]KAH7288348.1 hypothetical protein KP509_31G023000 [Ceratopteris richardii]